jgi:phosphatidylglycerol:prolipoprotein diacylglycerol transferase
MGAQKRNKIWLFSTLQVFIGLLVIYLLVILLARGEWKDSYRIAFTIFGHPIAWYGITMLTGFIFAIYLCCMKMYKYGVSVEPFYYFCIIGIPTSIFGARMGSCIIGQTQWYDFFNDFGSGLAIEWGVTFTAIAGLIYFPLVLRQEKYYVLNKDEKKSAYKQVSAWVYADCIIPAVLIGQIIGRFGNYFNQEVTGGVTNDANLIHFMQVFFPWMEINGQWYIPTFFFEQIGNIFGLILIYFVCEFIKNNKIRKCGDLAILYFLWYGIIRLIMTPLRMQGGHSGGEFINLITTICWICIGVILLIINHFVFSKYLRKYQIPWYFVSFANLFKGKHKYNVEQYVRNQNNMLWYNSL